MSFVPPDGYFSGSLAEVDPVLAGLLEGETRRQAEGIELIASENLVSRATLDALASPIVNKTVEGYPGHRYYGGAEFADQVEQLAIDRACELFDAAYANVQPHSGSQANLAVLLAFAKPGDTLLSMDLSAGGHLSHGAAPNISGKWFDVAHYGVGPDGLIDYDGLAETAERVRPRIIIAGGSSYPRAIDFGEFRAVADAVDAVLLVDMAHWAGLVAAGVHENPVPTADVVTTTTYKNLRGVRGGIILSNRPELGRRLDSAVFPGVQGSVMLNNVAAKAVCLHEALQPGFRRYGAAVLENARSLATGLTEQGLTVVTGGTDTPIVLLDLRSVGLTGDVVSTALESAGLTANKNSVPQDPEGPRVTSGVRLGSSAGTARGLDSDDFDRVGRWIAEVVSSLGRSDEATVRDRVRGEVRALVADHPIYD